MDIRHIRFEGAAQMAPTLLGKLVMGSMQMPDLHHGPVLVLFADHVEVMPTARKTALAEPRIHGLILSATSSRLVNRSPEDQKNLLAERLFPIEDGISIVNDAKPLITYKMAKRASGPLVAGAQCKRPHTCCAAFFVKLPTDG